MTQIILRTKNRGTTLWSGVFVALYRSYPAAGWGDAVGGGVEVVYFPLSCSGVFVSLLYWIERTISMPRSSWGPRIRLAEAQRFVTRPALGERCWTWTWTTSVTIITDGDMRESSTAASASPKRSSISKAMINRCVAGRKTRSKGNEHESRWEGPTMIGGDHLIAAINQMAKTFEFSV